MCLYIGIIFIFQNRTVTDNRLPVSIYFVNPATNRLEPDIRYIEKGENKEIAKNVLNMLYEGPKNTSLAKTMPENVKMLSGQIVNDTILEVEFSKEYKSMPPEKELFFRGSLVWTMTGLPFIRDVHIYVDGEELLTDNGATIGLLNRNNVLIDAKLQPEKIDTQWVKLYFTDKTHNALLPEERLIEVKDLSLEMNIVEHIIKGPSLSGLLPTISSEVLIRDVKTDEGICYVNLSGDFITKSPLDITNKRIIVYSIVNSLTELSSVKKVQFLIESENITGEVYGFDLSKPLSRDEALIQG